MAQTIGRPRIGYAGVGLMGHGAASNILAAGFPLTILGHRNRAPVGPAGAGHLLDPRTGRPAENGLLSVSVRAGREMVSA